MWGRKAARIAELEACLARTGASLAEAYDALHTLEDKHQRQTAMTCDLRAKLVGQRQQLKDKDTALAKRRIDKRLVDRARLVVAGWERSESYPDAPRHDGNHLEGCEPCEVFRELREHGTDWHRVLRARQLTHR